MKGIVKYFNVGRGYGFIAGDDGKDYFIHYKDIAGPPTSFKELAEGEKVEFQVMVGNTGARPQAANVVRFRDSEQYARVLCRS